MEFTIESSWKNALNDELSSSNFLQLMKFVENEYESKKGSILPDKYKVFRALEYCPIEKVKVVILGQDPYPTKGHANGLCFSVESDVFPLPKSLATIFQEIQNDLGLPFPENGNLERWAKQGVLLLNCVLTVEEGKSDSHAKKGWEEFTDAIINVLNERKEGIVYLLWGSKAAKKARNVNEKSNLLLTTSHPSPLSSYRGFLGCKHFSSTNEYLKKHGKDPIQW